MSAAIATTQQQAPNFALSLKDAAMPRTLADVNNLAVVVANSGMFGVKSPDDAMVRMLTGMELGLSPMQSLRGIFSVEGRPVMSADLAVAVILGSGKAEYFDCIETSDDVAIWETKRYNRPAKRFEFTIENAKRAELTGKGIWKKYPAAMLRARAAIALGRMVYQDVINGIYTEDELRDGSVVLETEIANNRAPKPELRDVSVPVKGTTVVTVVEELNVKETDLASAPDLGEVQTIIEWLKNVSTKQELLHTAESIKAKGLGGDKRIRAEYSAAKKRIDAQPVEANPEDDGR